MKKTLLIICFAITAFTALAQYSKPDNESKGFSKKNFFTGGTTNVSFFNQQTVLGISPYVGYSLTNFFDVALQANFNYIGQRSFDGTKARLYTYGPGTFARIFPLDNIFLQGGFEKNFISYKEILPNGGGTYKANYDVNSILVGGGYSNGRSREEKTVFYYFSILIDIKKDPLSPYTQVLQDGAVQMVPIVNAGLQIPLFQNSKKRSRQTESEE